MTCHETVFGVSKGILYQRYFCSKKVFMSVEFHGDHEAVIKFM